MNESQYYTGISNFLNEENVDQNDEAGKDREKELEGTELLNTAVPSGIDLLRFGLQNTGIKNAISSGLDDIEGGLGAIGGRALRIGRNVVGRLVVGDDFKPGRRVNLSSSTPPPAAAESSTAPASTADADVEADSIDPFAGTRPVYDLGDEFEDGDTPLQQPRRLPQSSGITGEIAPSTLAQNGSEVIANLSDSAERVASGATRAVSQVGRNLLDSAGQTVSRITRGAVNRVTGAVSGATSGAESELTATGNRLGGIVSQTRQTLGSRISGLFGAKPANGAAEATLESPFAEPSSLSASLRGMLPDQVRDFMDVSEGRPSAGLSLSDQQFASAVGIRGSTIAVNPDGTPTIQPASRPAPLNIGDDLTGSQTGGRPVALPGLTSDVAVAAGDAGIGALGLIGANIGGEAGRDIGFTAVGLGAAKDLATGNPLGIALSGTQMLLQEFGGVEGQEAAQGIGLGATAAAAGGTIYGIGSTVASTLSSTAAAASTLAPDAAIAGSADASLAAPVTTASIEGTLPLVTTTTTDVADAASGAIASLASTAGGTAIAGGEGGVVSTLATLTGESAVGDEDPIGGLVTLGLGLATAFAGLGEGIKDLFSHASSAPPPPSVSFQAGVTG